MEDSGLLGVYTDGVVMSNSGQTSYHKTFTLSNPTNLGIIPPNLLFVKPICLYKTLHKCVENVQLNHIKV